MKIVKHKSKGMSTLIMQVVRILENLFMDTTTEEEYISLTEFVKESLWLEGFIKELKLQG